MTIPRDRVLGDEHTGVSDSRLASQRASPLSRGDCAGADPDEREAEATEEEELMLAILLGSHLT